jgi:hypothetical protein
MDKNMKAGVLVGAAGVTLSLMAINRVKTWFKNATAE